MAVEITAIAALLESPEAFAQGLEAEAFAQDAVALALVTVEDCLQAAGLGDAVIAQNLANYTKIRCKAPRG